MSRHPRIHRRPGRALDLIDDDEPLEAARIAFHKLGGFSLDEVDMDARAALWLRGGFPRAFLAQSDEASAEWRREFIRTFLERDVPQLGIRVPAATLDRFWRMIAHYHGQIWNGSELARAFGVGATTVRRYLDTLTHTFVIGQFPPWHENIKKRQVRSPRVYVSDTGILHTLLGIERAEGLERHPKVGASWEGFVVQELTTRLGTRAEETFHWATHAGAALDCLVVRGARRLGFEVKRTTAPAVTRSMRSALETLRLERLDVIHAGEGTFPLAERIRAVSFARLHEDVEPL